MKIRRNVDTIVCAGIAAFWLFSAVAFAGSGDLAVGDRAPDFELPGSDDATYRLADFHGKQVVVLAWFPKAFTGG